MNAILNEFRSIGTNGVTDWVVAMTTASQLPGRIDGPADAYRHLLLSAELHRRFEPEYADFLLDGHELDDFFGSGAASNTHMDVFNNDIGKSIGIYVKSINGTTQDLIDIIHSVLVNSLPNTPAGARRGVENIAARC